MRRPLILSVVTFIAVITVIGALAWLTADENGSEVCTDTSQNVGAAVLAETGGDQEALVNRAIIVRGNCDQNERQ